MKKNQRVVSFVRSAYRIVSLSALGMMTMLVVGCLVGPNYRRPETAGVPAAYLGVSGAWKIATPQAALPKGPWWEVFGDFELNRLEGDAAEANQDLKASYARFEQARAAANVSTSGLYPRVGVSAQPVVQEDSKNRPVGGKPGQIYDTYTVPFDVSYEFDLWGRVRRARESATAQMQAVLDDVESVRLAVQAEIAADYFTIRALDADRALLLSSIETYQKALTLVRNRRDGGLSSDLDVAQAETVLMTVEAQLPDNALQRVKFEHALAALTGRYASLFSMPERPLDLQPFVVPAGLPSALLERRPDIAAAERRMAAANASVGVATAAFYPTFKFAGSIGLQSGDLSTLFGLPSLLWAVGPSVTLPVFQGGQLTSALGQAQAAYDETVARYRQTVLTAFADVENNLAAENLLAEQYEQLTAALKAARNQLAIANNRYGAGLVTYLEVATAQNTVLGIERSAMRLRGQQLVAAVALIKSIGGGWQQADKESGRS